MTQETTLESRINQLEIQLCDTEDTVDALNTAIFRQQQQIDLLTREIIELRRQQQTANNPAQPLSLRDELPPHY